MIGSRAAPSSAAWSLVCNFPALIEAFALHHADNTDAKLQTMSELLSSSEPGTEWLGYQRLLETNIRRTTPLV